MRGFDNCITNPFGGKVRANRKGKKPTFILERAVIGHAIHVVNATTIAGPEGGLAPALSRYHFYSALLINLAEAGPRIMAGASRLPDLQMLLS